MTFGAPVRRLLGLAIALATGLGSAILDTGPGFDDTGVLVTGLLVGSALAAFTAGRVSLPWLALLAAVAGLPVPLAELLLGGTPVAFVATALAAIGVGIGAAAARALAPEPRGTEPGARSR